MRKLGFWSPLCCLHPAETKIYEKEQKFLKVHGCIKEKVSDESPKNVSNQKSENDLQQFVSVMQVAQSFFQPALPTQSPPTVKNVNYRRPAAPRKIPQIFSGCFKCGDVSHFRFNNAANCQELIDFIDDEITSRLQSGAVTLLRKVGEVQPPYIVSPITIEPTKPRLCINLMYLNSFMKDTPFNLDTLVDVPKTVRKGSFLTKLDDKSGYDNVFVTESSRHLLGFDWGGYFFCCNTLPFGWENSAFIYHTLNLQGISFLRRKSSSCLLYIDDRLLEEFHGYLPNDLDNPIMKSHIALRYAVRLFISDGYFLNIDKSSFLPKQSLTFLGDEPSRNLSKSDASISKRTWWFLQYLFGPHKLDMFSIDSNTMLDEDGKSLPHFTPFPTPFSSGVDGFAQKYELGERY
ncbi:unnamed protein product [Mytilus edulis]|uniref:Reverse transcriptase domain-containing protein n=1 Tax=Mytilus edulis TaxID=6550 RepID=A0A8S3PNP5_MYTED|nr:unnamed protein product [Mytilus edulis]